MAYDSQSDRTILFGGDIGQIVLGNDTWAYDLDTNTWTEMTPVESPAPRFHPVTAYDTESDRVILFGGSVESESGDSLISVNETWAYDYDSNSWENLDPVNPPSRGGPMAYDSESDRIILFHSRGTWSFDFNANEWKLMQGGTETPTRSGDMAYDEESDLVVLFMGTRAETWTYDLNTDSWTNRTSSKAPSPRNSHRMAYDRESDRVILFGGQFGPYRKNDTWSYDSNTNTWTEMNPPGRPGVRDLHTMTYDVESDRIVLFGGQVDEIGFSPINDETWVYNHGPTTPTAPTQIVAVSSDQQVDLSWKPPSDGESAILGHRVRRGTFPGEFALLAELGNVTGFADRNVTNCLRYYYEVVAMNAVGEGPPSLVSAVPQGTPCAPRNLRLTLLEREVHLNWAPPLTHGAPPVTGYRIYRGSSPLELSELASVGVRFTYQDRDAPDGVILYYAVSAINALGEGARSDSVSATLVDGTPPFITILFPEDGSVVDSTRITLTGTATDNVEVQRVDVSLDGVSWRRAEGTATWNATVYILEGANRVFARATDPSGNERSVSIGLTVVPRPPFGSLGPEQVVLLVAGATVALAGGAGAALLLRRRNTKRD